MRAVKNSVRILLVFFLFSRDLQKAFLAGYRTISLAESHSLNMQFLKLDFFSLSPFEIRSLLQKEREREMRG